MEFNNILTILIICGAVSRTIASKCYECVHLKSTIVIPHTTGMSEDQACRDGDTTKMKSVECVTGSACIKATAYITGSALGTDVEAEITARQCLGVDALSGECRTMDGHLASLIRSPGLDKATGTECICTTDNCNGQSIPAPVIFTFVICLVIFIFVPL